MSVYMKPCGHSESHTTHAWSWAGGEYTCPGLLEPVSKSRHIEHGASFDFNTAGVARGFDGHVREQLPWYEIVTTAISHIARHYVPHGGLVYDVAASNGNVGRALAPLLTERQADLIALEPAEAMADTYSGPGTLIVEAAQDHDFQPFDFGVVMLGLMFMPPARVPEVLEKMVQAINPHGALVVVERMIPAAGYLSIVSSRMTLAAKLDAGASPQEIIAKELSLSGIQHPLPESLFRTFDGWQWFRYGDFAGWLIESPKVWEPDR